MTLCHFLLQALHKCYSKLFIHDKPRHLCGITDPDEASDTIYHLLLEEKPCMIARYGSVELQCFSIAYCKSHDKKSPSDYVFDKQPQWWWNELNCQEMKTNAGFFPNTKKNLLRFGKLMEHCSTQLDMLGIWRPNEKYISHLWPSNIKLTPLMNLEPFWSERPWSRALKGKHVLVIHPFAEQIEYQYKNNRNKLFANPDALPEFHLETIKAVQSLGGEDNGFIDWFEALNWMKSEMQSKSYDIALIGCGAYGFPLAAYAKETGHKAVHLGGSLQLLFGLKGKRWENPMYGVERWNIPVGKYSNLINEYWQRPNDNLKPTNANKVEDACYW